MPREFRQCWAYYDSNRCSLRAGHQGDHVRKITWTDADCQGAPLIEVLAVDEPVPFIPVQQPNPVGRCVACSHSHSGECKCGCKEFIG
jgi:hypothetical protein